MYWNVKCIGIYTPVGNVEKKWDSVEYRKEIESMVVAW